MKSRLKQRQLILCSVFIALILFSCIQVSQQKTEESSTPETEFIWYDSTFYYGKVEKGEKVYTSFRFRNNGQRTLRLRAYPSFGGLYVTPLYSVLSGKSGKIEAIFHTEGVRPGIQNKTIQIYSEAGGMILKIQGEVLEK